jgi:hypothetical protein
MQELLMELDRLPIDESARAQVKGLLRRMAGQRVHLGKRSLVDPERVRLALSMLRAGSSATQVRVELAATLHCSKWTAQRIVTRALSQRAEAGILARQGVGSPQAAESLYGAEIQGVK